MKEVERERERERERETYCEDRDCGVACCRREGLQACVVRGGRSEGLQQCEGLWA
jgi:hypothetical protein